VENPGNWTGNENEWKIQEIGREIEFLDIYFKDVYFFGNFWNFYFYLFVNFQGKYDSATVIRGDHCRFRSRLAFMRDFVNEFASQLLSDGLGFWSGSGFFS
jgi:hypothetical protein